MNWFGRTQPAPEFTIPTTPTGSPLGSPLRDSRGTTSPSLRDSGNLCSFNSSPSKAIPQTKANSTAENFAPFNFNNTNNNSSNNSFSPSQTGSFLNISPQPYDPFPFPQPQQNNVQPFPSTPNSNSGFFQPSTYDSVDSEDVMLKYNSPLTRSKAPLYALVFFLPFFPSVHLFL